jgi:hypothetical protein
MKAAVATTTQREQSEQARARALVRFNGTMFRSLAAASFLETAVPLHVGRLAHALGADPDLRLWLEQIWWPRRAELGRQLRVYIDATWPEFDWNAAYLEFQEGYRPSSALEGASARTAREILGLCVMEAQAALLYRALAKCADEPHLRTLAGQAAAEHVEFFEYFRTCFEQRKRVERVGFIATVRTVNAVCRSARDHDVASAFRALDSHWGGDRIVPALAYPEFRQRVMQLLLRHAALGPIERLLFRPWLERVDVHPVQPPHPDRHSRWFSLAVQPTGA